MELKLTIDGKKKTFKPMPNLPALRFKQATNHATQLEEHFSIECLEACVEFLANDIYGGKFTSEQFWNGCPAEDLITSVRDSLAHPMMLMRSKLEPLKN
ncbi:hypothetical protein BC7_00021 [Bacillus phage BC-7]|nr:hypothetical protein BC7_00021 [Bacillus phage BC-7]